MTGCVAMSKSQPSLYPYTVVWTEGTDRALRYLAQEGLLGVKQHIVIFYTGIGCPHILSLNMRSLNPSLLALSCWRNRRAIFENLKALKINRCGLLKENICFGEKVAQL